MRYENRNVYLCTEDTNITLPVKDLVLLSAFAYKEESSRLKLMLFSRTSLIPFIVDAEEIDYTAFPTSASVFTGTALRKALHYLCTAHADLFIDQATNTFIDQGKILALNLDDLAVLISSLVHSLETKGFPQEPPAAAQQPPEAQPETEVPARKKSPKPQRPSTPHLRPRSSRCICPSCGLEQEKTDECAVCGAPVSLQRLRRHRNAAAAQAKRSDFVRFSPLSLMPEDDALEKPPPGFWQKHKVKVIAMSSSFGCLVIAALLLWQPLTNRIYSSVPPPPSRTLSEKLDNDKTHVASSFGDKTALIQAAREGDGAQVKTLLALGDDADFHVPYVCTPLHAAAMEGHEEVVSLLLTAGADVNTRHTGGETPLHCAVSQGHNAVSARLIEHGADVNAKDKNGDTPLHVAATQGHVRVLKLLLSAHAAVNITNNREATPLHFAATRGRKEAVEILLAHGADANARNRLGDTPLHCAAVGGHEPVAQILLAGGAHVDARNLRKKTPRDCAAAWNHQEVARLIARHGGKG